jgi:acyl-CoA thioesterase-1
MLVSSPLAAAAERSILVLGDSLSAAYGIPRARGWVTLLEARLKREQSNYIVVNASVSGETSAGGRSRLQPLLEKHKPAVVILELGANDGLRGLPLAQLKANLEQIIVQSQKVGARVLLVGVKLPPNYGEEYLARFDAVFRDLAKKHRTGLVPFLMEDFGGKAEFFQDDRLHPNERAQPLMLEQVWKGLRPLLR